MSAALKIVIINDEPRIRSDIVARKLDLLHQKMLDNLVVKYIEEFKEFGACPFEKDNTVNKIAMLNEDQACLLLTYVRNTEKARAAKRELIRAFRKARDRLAEIEKEKPLTEYDVWRGVINRVEELDQRVGVVEGATQQHDQRIGMVEHETKVIRMEQQKQQHQPKRKAKPALPDQTKLDIDPLATPQLTHSTGTGSPKKTHTRKEHYRQLSDGRRVRVRACIIGGKS